VAVMTSTTQQEPFCFLKVTSKSTPPSYPPCLGWKHKNFDLGSDGAPASFPSRRGHLETAGLVVELGVGLLVASSGSFILDVAVQ
jgi:hypothetical protein